MIKVDELQIPKNEVLRYLGYKGQNVDENLNKLIDDTIKECKELIVPRYIYAEYKNEIKDDGVHIKGSNLVLKGNDIKNHLIFSNEIVIMAVTIGSNIEKKISLYERINLTKAMILDSCATTAVEELCDKVEALIKSEARKKSLGITFRYSPGYGDLPLNIQKDIISILKADKTIGLTTSPHHILFPRKSVTAIIGLVPIEKEEKQRGCEVCKNYSKCRFRREGYTCGA